MIPNVVQEILQLGWLKTLSNPVELLSFPLLGHILAFIQQESVFCSAGDAGDWKFNQFFFAEMTSSPRGNNKKNANHIGGRYLKSNKEKRETEVLQKTGSKTGYLWHIEYIGKQLAVFVGEVKGYPTIWHLP